MFNFQIRAFNLESRMQNFHDRLRLYMGRTSYIQVPCAYTSLKIKKKNKSLGKMEIKSKNNNLHSKYVYSSTKVAILKYIHSYLCPAYHQHRNVDLNETINVSKKKFFFHFSPSFYIVHFKRLRLSKMNF